MPPGRAGQPHRPVRQDGANARAAEEVRTKVMAGQAARAKTNVVYLLQTHTGPAQVARLVRVITEGSPGAMVLMSHDKSGPSLDVAGLRALGNVHVFGQQGGYGDFSHVDRYLAAVDWLDAHGIDYDWLENLSGQDYPLRPVAEIEDALAGADADGFLQYSPVFPERVPGGAGQGTPGYTLVRAVDAATRYDYRHWRFGRPTPAKRRWMRPLMVLNYVQPWVRVSNSYAWVGIRRRTVFGPGFHCYGGSFFCTLRAECAQYVRDYARANPETVACFRAVLAPEEVFLHSVLVNSGRFNLSPDYRRYIDWTGCTHTHPRTLGTGDLPAMLASRAHWARKLDPGADARLLDLLDHRVRPGPAIWITAILPARARHSALILPRAQGSAACPAGAAAARTRGPRPTPARRTAAPGPSTTARRSPRPRARPACCTPGSRRQRMTAPRRPQPAPCQPGPRSLSARSWPAVRPPAPRSSPVPGSPTRSPASSGGQRCPDDPRRHSDHHTVPCTAPARASAKAGC